MSKRVMTYPRPGPIGGRLIRAVIQFLKKQGVELPLTSHILIATSGGADSVALGHLITHFGRRIVPRNKIHLLHVNHGWRGAESDRDENHVKHLGEIWGVPVSVKRLDPKQIPSGSSWEEEARKKRKEIFVEEADRLNARVFTAHQADDLAETLLWRLFTGAASTHGGGITVQHGVEMRPFLQIRKSEIKAYLKEVNVEYCEDSTNHSDRFMRAQMRSHLMPEIERLFPKAIQHLNHLALEGQQRELQQSLQMTDELLPYQLLFQASGLRARRSHFEILQKKLLATQVWYGEIHLPGGWRLVREKKPGIKKAAYSDVHKSKEVSADRWILEKV